MKRSVGRTAMPPRTGHPESPIAVRRIAMGWTQDVLAARAGLSVDAVKKHEAGRVKTWPTSTTRLIAGALGCAIDDLRVPHGTGIIVHVHERA